MKNLIEGLNTQISDAKEWNQLYEQANFTSFVVQASDCSGASVDIT